MQGGKNKKVRKHLFLCAFLCVDHESNVFFGANLNLQKVLHKHYVFVIRTCFWREMKYSIFEFQHDSNVFFGANLNLQKVLHKHFVFDIRICFWRETKRIPEGIKRIDICDHMINSYVSNT